MTSGGGVGRRRSASRGTGLLLLMVASLFLGCRSSAPEGAQGKVVEDQERRCRYVIPPGWNAFDGEVRSHSGSLLTIRVYDLEGAAPTFVAELPDSLLPQLEEWARYYYVVGGPPVRAATSLGGAPATEFTYPVSIRPGYPASKLTYRIVRKDQRLFVLRAVLVPNAPAEDETNLTGLLASWSFL